MTFVHSALAIVSCSLLLLCAAVLGSVWHQYRFRFGAVSHGAVQQPPVARESYRFGSAAAERALAGEQEELEDAFAVVLLDPNGTDATGFFNAWGVLRTTDFHVVSLAASLEPVRLTPGVVQLERADHTPDSLWHTYKRRRPELIVVPEFTSPITQATHGTLLQYVKSVEQFDETMFVTLGNGFSLLEKAGLWKSHSVPQSVSTAAHGKRNDVRFVKQGFLSVAGHGQSQLHALIDIVAHLRGRGRARIWCSETLGVDFDSIGANDWNTPRFSRLEKLYATLHAAFSRETTAVKLYENVNELSLAAALSTFQWSLNDRVTTFAHVQCPVMTSGGLQLIAEHCNVSTQNAPFFVTRALVPVLGDDMSAATAHRTDWSECPVRFLASRQPYGVWQVAQTLLRHSSPRAIAYLAAKQLELDNYAAFAHPIPWFDAWAPAAACFAFLILLTTTLYITTRRKTNEKLKKQ